MKMSLKGFMNSLNALWIFLLKLVWILKLRCWSIFNLFVFVSFPFLFSHSLIYYLFNSQIVPFRCNQSLRLPSQLRDPLLHEVETHILGALADKQAEKRTVSDINFICALLSNFIHGSLVTRWLLFKLCSFFIGDL